jgi:O-antigen/teichoic acid export membrane protein
MLQSLLAWLRSQSHRLFSAVLIRVLKNSGYLFSATGAAAALGFAQSMLITRMLGVANFGILGGILLFTSLVNKFASFRMGELVIRYVGAYSEAGDPRRAAAVFKAAALFEMLVSVFAFALIWVLSPLAAALFGKDSGLAPLFALYGLIVLANLISESATGLLQIFDRFRSIAAAQVTGSVITFTTVAAAFILQGGMREVLLAYMLGKTAGSAVLTFSAFQQAARRWGRGWLLTSLRLLDPKARELARFAISTNISASVNLVNKDSEVLGVLLFRPPEEAGYYRIALAVINLMQLPLSPLPQATYPEMARAAARKQWASLREILRKSSILAGAYSLVLTVGLVLLGRIFIDLAYGREFVPAYPALVILLAGYLFANTFYWNRTVLLALGRPDYPMKVNLIAAVGKLAGIVLFVPRFGYLASAALLAGFYLFSVNLSVFKARSIISRREQEIEAETELPSLGRTASDERQQEGPA